MYSSGVLSSEVVVVVADIVLAQFQLPRKVVLRQKVVLDLFNCAGNLWCKT